MEVELLDFDRKANRMVFVLRGTDNSVVNALRRIAVEEVPVMAIEDVEIRKNSSVLYDEIIAHRLGLVPLVSDLESYNLPAECKCEGVGCARCQVKLTLSADEPGVVYSEEIKSKDPKVKPVFGKMPIVELLKGQKLEIEATAVLGVGREHSKWSPGIVHYKHYPIIKSVKDLDPSLVVSFPKIFANVGGKVVISEKDLLKSHLTDSIDEVSEGAVTVEDSPTDFVFFVESWSQLGCKELMEHSVDMLDRKFADFQKEFAKK